MVKSKFPGKPSKLIQRTLISAYSIVVPSYDTSAITEDLCHGLSVFEEIFGSGEQKNNFNGFTRNEIEISRKNLEEFSEDVLSKFVSRGLAYSHPSSIKYLRTALTSNDVPRCKKTTLGTENASLICKKGLKKCKLWLLSKKGSIRYHPKIPVRHTFKTLNKNSLIRFKHKTLSANYLTDKYCRKFILPSRSLHSSRVIKPNKRFIDIEKNYESKIPVGNIEPYNAESEMKADSSNQFSAQVSSSKVIIREARLNITTEPVIAGPFSIKRNLPPDKDKLKSGFITCGVCGVIRHYKCMLQAKKFGLFSCEPCRRFILKMIKQSKSSNSQYLKCKAENGLGKCVIYLNGESKESTDDCSTKTARCEACWLSLCLQRYVIPNTLRKSLIKLIPEDLKIFLSKVLSVDLGSCSHPRAEHVLETKNAILKEKSGENLNEHFTSINRLIKSAVRSSRRSLERERRESNTTMKSKVLRLKKSLSSQRFSSKTESFNESSGTDNEFEKSRYLTRGPRIKHVCRSASSVLRKSMVTLDDGDSEDFPYHGSESETGRRYRKNSVSGDSMKFERESQPHRIRQCSNNAATPSSTVSGNTVDHQNDDESFIQIYGARKLQDFSKESSNDESDDNEDKLISTDFWEAYDPDQVFKTGFPLICTEPINVRALCFLCGSAGIEKLLYCTSCCESYHWYCAEGPSMFREGVDEVEKLRVNWICRKCKVCCTCGKGSDSRIFTSCKRCKNSYHAECLNSKALNKRLFKSDRPWVCPSCLKCKSCDAKSVFTHVGNIPLCSQCFKLRQKGNYCPLCQGCYQDEDYNVQMMECGVCKNWIHAKCEQISYEKYQVLSFLPDTIEFICRLCCKESPAQWWLAVEEELKSGYLGILECLCKNKKMSDLLKDTPQKGNTCSCSKNRTTTSVVLITEVKEPQLEMNEKTENAIGNSYLPLDSQLAMAAEKCENESKNKDVSITAVPSTPANEVESPCVCNSRKRSDISGRLLTIKSNVRSNQYTSLYSFHQEVENVLSRVEEFDLIEVYREILKQFFPWFEPENLKIDESNCNNYCDKKLNMALDSNGSNGLHSHRDALSSVSLEIIGCNNDRERANEDGYEILRKLVAAEEYDYENIRMLDVRKCNLCKSMGEAIPSEGGRLIYCGRNEWVHSNCALWSSEVFEEIDGSLQNVHSAVSRGRQIRCSVCDKKGASVGCCFKNCALTYHFICAKKARCVFLQNKTIYCHNHQLREIMTPSAASSTSVLGTTTNSTGSLLVDEKDFEILRPVYVETDRKKKKLECHTNVKLRIGSLNIENLGKIDPHLSDNPQHILPIYFRCTRLFWSTLKPWKIVQYHVQIKVSYSYQFVSNEEEVNYTVDHSATTSATARVASAVFSFGDREENADSNNEHTSSANRETDETDAVLIKQLVDELVDTVCATSDDNYNETTPGTDLLSPELQEAIYKDLPKDFLNDGSLHDMWNSYEGTSESLIGTVACGRRMQAPSFMKEICDIAAENKLEKEVELIMDSTPIITTTCSTTATTATKIETNSRTNTSAVNKDIVQKKDRIDISNNSFKCLRDKNDLADGNLVRQRHVAAAAAAAAVAAADALGSLYNQLRTKGKRKMNFENSTLAKKRARQNGVYISAAKLSNVVVDYYTSSYENIVQLDGMVELQSDEEPVTCVQCYRTYRTTLSFQRHLSTCNVDFSDYMISSCESDSVSSEEEKFPSTVPKMEFLEDAPTVAAVTASETAKVATVDLSAVKLEQLTSHMGESVDTAALFQAKYSGTTYVIENNDKTLATPIGLSSCATNICSDVQLNNIMYPCTPPATIAVGTCFTGDDLQNTVTFQSAVQNLKQQNIVNNLSTMSMATSSSLASVSAFVEPTTMKFNFIDNGSGVGCKLTCPDYGVQQITLNGISSNPSFAVQNIPATPTYLIQEYSKPEVMPTYVAINNGITSATVTATNCLQSSETILTAAPQPLPPLQLQPIAAVNQTAINFQPTVLPTTILGTVLQPNTVEQPTTFIVNTSSPSQPVTATAAGLFTSQNDIIIPNQPVLIGLETMISNTVMSSSHQFLAAAGDLGSSTLYSTTTTQFFQAAKQLTQPQIQPSISPLVTQIPTNYSSGFIVLNSGISSWPTVQQQQQMQIQAETQTQPQHMSHAQKTNQQRQLKQSNNVVADQSLLVQQPKQRETASVVSNGEQYLYVQIADSSCNQTKKVTPSIIMKPASKSNPPIKKSTRVMKVKNNCPVTIHTVSDDNNEKLCTTDKENGKVIKKMSKIVTKKPPNIPSFPTVKKLVNVDTPAAAVVVSSTPTSTSFTHTSEMKNLQIKVVDETVVARDQNLRNANIHSTDSLQTASTTQFQTRDREVSVSSTNDGNIVCRNNNAVKLNPAQINRMHSVPSVKTTIAATNITTNRPALTERKNTTMSWSSKNISASVTNSFTTSPPRVSSCSSIEVNKSDYEKQLPSFTFASSAEFELLSTSRRKQEEKNAVQDKYDIRNTVEENEPLRLEGNCNKNIDMEKNTAKFCSKTETTMSVVTSPRSSTTSDQMATTVTIRSMPLIDSIGSSVQKVSETDKIFDELLRQHKFDLETCKIKKSSNVATPSTLSSSQTSSLNPVDTQYYSGCDTLSSTNVEPCSATQKLFVLPDKLIANETRAPVSQNSNVSPENVLSILLPSLSSSLKNDLGTSSYMQQEHAPVSCKNSTISFIIPDKNKYKPNLTGHKLSTTTAMTTTAVTTITSSSLVKEAKNKAKEKSAIHKSNFDVEMPLTKLNTIKKKRSPEKENENNEKTATSMASQLLAPELENKNWKTASISYEVNAEDGFSYKTNDLLDLWTKILESVQQSRAKYKLPLLPKNVLVNSSSVYNLLGFENNASKYLLEQLPDAWKCIFYKPVFHKSASFDGRNSSTSENASGCARTEPFTSSHKYDMFGWLASRHRKPPKFMLISDSDIVNGNRRVTSLNLPMAMRFRHLKETAKETVGVFRSDIHGRGLFCLRDIDAGEMVIEYAGEVIRSTLTDKREKFYTSKGIGCYMFRIDDKYVVDATMCGNAARFINHSCDPNCYSRIVDILGKKHILIFALRRIPKGEELTYDYKFPLEDDKIHCHCLSRKCRKYLN